MSIYFLMIIVVFLVLVFYKANRNTSKVAVNSITVARTNLQISKKQLRILHLSDLHLENISVTPAELFRIISDQPVDLIALTGDFLDRKRTVTKLIPYLEVLKSLKPHYGTYAVFGNHDYILKEKDFNVLKQTLEQYGCKTLQNEHCTIELNGEKLNIIGIDDFSTKRSDIAKAYHGLPDGYHLVITHDPNIVLDMKDYHYDYLLSGHFHGGQIHWPKPYHLVKMGKLVRMNMVKGLHYHHGKPFYISEGLGQTGVNIRIGSRPEITFHEIG
ncbi:metallophosphoesterase [Bacillus canaveralius]|uniref:Metallophosphoesterase n=1 Tax=Bacillus canaveralius TaxID=1403243 RepID=A0A2N5GIJ8_9BACI|nr:metallophosphoesterase [Bacillus canaveralius]PLR80828.1 metallophosphoesterase [Bacillus canaveralius]PLR98296.1 metallophosphoesterase [Bacillus canaveralius]RSK51642.1 metallophosphoesterase [Bacillus canaveralius]